MVTKKQILSWVDKPTSLALLDLKKLEKIIETYPYFSIIEILLSKGYHDMESIKYHDQIKATAIAVPDREALYHFIMKMDKKEALAKEGEPLVEDKEVVSPTVKVVVEEKEPLVEKIEDDLEDLMIIEAASSYYDLKSLPDIKKEDKGDLVRPIVTNSNKNSFYNWLTPVEVVKNKSEELKSIDDLVEDFLNDRDNERLRVNEFYSPEVKAKDSLEDDGEIVTETLAAIYFQQKKYKKAKESFEKLILKIPEKKPYFVDQIEKIKKILNS